MIKEKNKLVDWWCTRAWIKVSCMIAIVMTGIILLNWKTWSTELKVIASIAVLIPLHVVEEWIFPGGFHYQYNTLQKSNQLHCYPMNRVSDMFTNLLATFLYIGLTIFGAIKGTINTGIILGTIIFCILEVVVHTLLGSVMYKKFKGKGKTTLYGPGSITAYFGFGVLGTILLYCLEGRTIVATDWISCIGVLAFILVLCILLPENSLKKKNHPYAFSSAGYYERFLK